MERIRRWTKIIFDIAAFSVAVMVMIAILSTLIYSAHASFYVKDNMDQVFTEWIRFKSELDAKMDRLDGQSEYIRTKIKQLERIDAAKVQKAPPKSHNP